jgi:hypothetical protein
MLSYPQARKANKHSVTIHPACLPLKQAYDCHDGKRRNKQPSFQLNHLPSCIFYPILGPSSIPCEQTCYMIPLDRSTFGQTAGENFFDLLPLQYKKTFVNLEGIY